MYILSEDNFYTQDVYKKWLDLTENIFEVWS